MNNVALFVITEDDDWNIIVIETESLASSWEKLVIYLGLPFDLINNTIRPASNCWSEALNQWIKQNYNTKKFGQPSWRTLLRAVAQVNKLQFKKLAEKHRGMLTVHQGSNSYKLNSALLVLCWACLIDVSV